ncbi:helix-turn-helix transcriptional regulator [Streptomyces sp. H27-H1]|uniref:helix-turn-helix transcriptional regulator n=1 Tax=Streptomyces sp. H27-H1 TaxID=2996461 RepID=UPI00226E3DEA|nr:helix-turn-helix transcriptional regulator [Streptomyces sp. H27-H1]MCY0929020.1 helix-turn-helix transcriptional regulator [Streptomyces sp. H27-H1]
MDNNQEVREFLTSRRAKISPEQAAMPSGSRRRVPGLRRSEVAALADMSVEYYAKLERGNLAGVSPAVLEAVARALQLDDAERAHLLHLAQAADIVVAILRTEAGLNPHDKDLHDLVGELSTRSDEFRTSWGAHNVRRHGTGTKRFHHQAVGELTLAYEGLDMTAEAGLTLTIYTAEPGSPSEEGLRLLASWAAPQKAHPSTQQSPG